MATLSAYIADLINQVHIYGSVTISKRFMKIYFGNRQI